MSLSDKVTQFNTDADLTHQIVHGDANTTVQTAGGPVRSLAKLVADSQTLIAAQVPLRADLRAATGAGQVGTSDGSTVQARLDALGSAGGGTVTSVNGVGPTNGNVTLTTDKIGEGQATQYFTAARALATVLQGLDTSRNAAITAADTLLSGMGKLQKQISDWIAAKDASSGYPGMTYFSINFRDAANKFTSLLANANTAVRTYVFPDRSGTVALTTNETHVNPTIKGYIEQFQALNPGAAVTVDRTLGTVIKITTSQTNTAITLPPTVAGAGYAIIVKYGATGHAVSFAAPSGSTLSWFGGAVPGATSFAGKRDKYIFLCDDEVTMGQDGGRGA